MMSVAIYFGLTKISIESHNQSVFILLQISSGFMRTAKANNVAANAAFRSSSKRAAESHKKFVTPAPGTQK